MTEVMYGAVTGGRDHIAGGRDHIADERDQMTGGGDPMIGGRYPVTVGRDSMTSGMHITKSGGEASKTDGIYGRMPDRNAPVTPDRKAPATNASERISEYMGRKGSTMPPMPWDQLFSESSLRMQDTTVRDLLKLSGRKDMILFAAGVTVPGMDSLDALRRIQADVVKIYGHTAVQHMPADGFHPLRESITGLMSKRGINASVTETMLLTGSQQGLDLVARAFIDPGDVVFVEEPTFFSAIHIFRAAGARIVGVPTDKTVCVQMYFHCCLRGSNPSSFIPYLIFRTHRVQ